MKKYLLITILLFSYLLQAQKFDTLAQTPPMGWNSWNTFQTDINAELVKDVADEFIENGLKEAGYEYIVLDDGWMKKKRDSAGNFVPHPEKFPNGLEPVIDYVHSKGLKFGLYSCAGSKTCAGYPGSRGHEYQDARSFAKWGVDYLKYDWCSHGERKAEAAYTTMRNALHEAGRPVVFSICEWGNNEPWKWAQDVGHLWRTTGDIALQWSGKKDHGGWYSWGVTSILDKQIGLRKYAGPGHWNDPDMLQVGNGLTESEDRAHFAMWSMLAAPLMMGNDLRDMSEETVDILTNEEVISVDQDSLGIQGFKYTTTDSMEVWAKPLVDGDWAICFLNRNEDSYNLNFDWSSHTIKDTLNNRKLDPKNNTYTIRDLFQHKNIGTTKEVLKTDIPTHDILMLRLTEKN